jgi:hypothetical protein
MTTTHAIQETAIYATVGAIGNNVAKVAGIGTVAGGVMQLNDAGIFVGMACAIAGVLVGWYYKRKDYQLREKYYKAVHGLPDDRD